MKLFIPACGDNLTTTAPWTFDLYLEHRNIRFAKDLGLVGKEDYEIWEGDRRNGRYKKLPVTLPTGTILECDRVYIRHYNKGRVQLEDYYDSITWRIQKVKGKEGKGKISGRFWVKLPDCYGIEYELSVDSLYRDRIKAVRLVLED